MGQVSLLFGQENQQGCQLNQVVELSLVQYQTFALKV